MKNIPRNIYLCLGNCSIDDIKDFDDLSEVTWSTDKIFDNDIKYSLNQWHDILKNPGDNPSKLENSDRSSYCLISILSDKGNKRQTEKGYYNFTTSTWHVTSNNEIDENAKAVAWMQIPEFCMENNNKLEQLINEALNSENSQEILNFMARKLKERKCFCKRPVMRSDIVHMERALRYAAGALNARERDSCVKRNVMLGWNLAYDILQNRQSEDIFLNYYIKEGQVPYESERTANRKENISDFPQRE